MPTWRTLFDPFAVALLGTVALATALPATGWVAEALELLTQLAIVWLFAMHGARLSREAIRGALLDWRLHLMVLAGTWLLFPAFGLALRPLAALAGLPEPLGLGLLYLCALPSTVQSSIAFTSIARGNVAGAVCAAALSNLAGVALTPLLTVAMLATQGSVGPPWQAIGDIVGLLLLPFVIGHLARPWVGGFVERHHRMLGLTDRSTVLLVVYGAFSRAVTQGLWSQVPPAALLGLVLLSLVLLAAVMLPLTLGARRLGFSVEDEIAIVFCGSKKSLATGIPMANILFAGHPALGMLVLPAMVFHQVQLMVCAVLARRYSAR